MLVSKALSYLRNLAGQVQSDPRIQFSDMPKEILPHIFRSLPLGDSSAVHFSRVCKEFYSVYQVCYRRTDRLLSSDCKTIEFVQKNRLRGFVTHSQDTVITLDGEENICHQRVTIWSSQEPPVKEPAQHCSSFFYNPIHCSAIGGTTIPYFAAAQSNYQGKIQVWNLNNKTKVMETRLNREISSLYGYNELLLAGFEDGIISWYNFSDLTLIKELPAHDAPIKFMFVDSSIKRMMTSSTNCIKIWDLEKLNCIKEIKLNNFNNLLSYDLETATLISVCEKKRKESVIFWSAQDGKEIASVHCPIEEGSFSALHLNAKTGLLFAAYYYVKENPTLSRSGIAVWDVKTKNLLKDFPALLREDPAADLHVVVSTIDFDSDSGLIMTSSNAGIHLWSLEKAVHIQRLDMPKGSGHRIKWDKSRHRLFALINGKLYLKDYSNNPFQIVEAKHGLQ